MPPLGPIIGILDPFEDEGGRCDEGKPCITPLNLEGRIYSGNLMVGGNGGSPGVPVRVIEGYDPNIRGPESNRGGLVKFNLGTATDLSGNYACCDGYSSYPPDELAVVHRLELLFDYLDATFIVPTGAGTAIAGKTYTIRRSGTRERIRPAEQAWRSGGNRRGCRTDQDGPGLNRGRGSLGIQGFRIPADFLGQLEILEQVREP